MFSHVKIVVLIIIIVSLIVSLYILDERKPINLPCGHVFCEKCIYKQIKDFIDSEDSNFQCFKDKKKIKIDKDNLIICHQILSHLPSKKTKSNKNYSHLNKNIQFKNRNKDKDKDKDKDKPKKENLKKISPPLPLPPKEETTFYCKRHPSQQITHFCSSHSVFPCSQCIEENHKTGCQLDPFSSLLDLDKLTQTRTQVERFESQLKKDLSSLDNKIQFVNNFYEKQLININHQIDNLIKHILDNKTKITQLLRLSHSQHTKHFLSQHELLIQNQSSLSSIHSLLLNIDQLLLNRNFEDFHQSLQQLFSQFNHLTSSLPNPEHPFAYYLLNSKFHDIGTLQYFSLSQVQTLFKETDHLLTTKQLFYPKQNRSQTPAPRNRNPNLTDNTNSNIHSSKDPINITNNTNIFNISSCSFNKNDNSRLSNNINIFKDNLLNYKTKLRDSNDTSNLIHSNRSNTSSNKDIYTCNKKVIDLNINHNTSHFCQVPISNSRPVHNNLHLQVTNTNQSISLKENDPTKKVSHTQRNDQNGNIKTTVHNISHQIPNLIKNKNINIVNKNKEHKLKLPSQITQQGCQSQGHNTNSANTTGNIFNKVLKHQRDKEDFFKRPSSNKKTSLQVVYNVTNTHGNSKKEEKVFYKNTSKIIQSQQPPISKAKPDNIPGTETPSSSNTYARSTSNTHLPNQTKKERNLIKPSNIDTQYTELDRQPNSKIGIRPNPIQKEKSKTSSNFEKEEKPVTSIDNLIKKRLNYKENLTDSKESSNLSF